MSSVVKKSKENREASPRSEAKRRTERTKEEDNFENRNRKKNHQTLPAAISLVVVAGAVVAPNEKKPDNLAAMASTVERGEESAAEAEDTEAGRREEEEAESEEVESCAESVGTNDAGSSGLFSLPLASSGARAGERAAALAEAGMNEETASILLLMPPFAASAASFSEEEEALPLPLPPPLPAFTLW